MIPTRTLWFTGLSGAGKSTICERFSARLESHDLKFTILDGDVIRTQLHQDLGFAPSDIKKNNELISQLCFRHQGEYYYILVSIISPFRESRQKARDLIKSNFVEVYVKAPLEELIKRDVKGLYKKALNGQIQNFIGIDPQVLYEEPLNPEVILETDKEDVETSVGKLESYIISRFGKL